MIAFASVALLTVACGFCHVIGAYEKEDKEEKQSAGGAITSTSKATATAKATANERDSRL